MLSTPTGATREGISNHITVMTSRVASSAAGGHSISSSLGLHSFPVEWQRLAKSHEVSQPQSWQCGNWLSPSFSSAICNTCPHFQVPSPSCNTSSRWWQPAKITGTGKKGVLPSLRIPSKQRGNVSFPALPPSVFLLKCLITCLDLNQSCQRELNVNRLEQNRIQPRVTWDRGRNPNKTCKKKKKNPEDSG